MKAVRPGSPTRRCFKCMQKRKEAEARFEPAVVCPEDSSKCVLLGQVPRQWKLNVTCSNLAWGLPIRLASCCGLLARLPCAATCGGRATLQSVGTIPLGRALMGAQQVDRPWRTLSHSLVTIDGVQSLSPRQPAGTPSSAADPPEGSCPPVANRRLV